jgi:hypothetical protein
MLLEYFSDRAKECIRFAQKATSAHDRELFLALSRAFYGIVLASPELLFSNPAKRGIKSGTPKLTRLCVARQSASGHAMVSVANAARYLVLRPQSFYNFLPLRARG